MAAEEYLFLFLLGRGVEEEKEQICILTLPVLQFNRILEIGIEAQCSVCQPPPRRKRYLILEISHFPEFSHSTHIYRVNLVEANQNIVNNFLPLFLPQCTPNNSPSMFTNKY